MSRLMKREGRVDLPSLSCSASSFGMWYASLISLDFGVVEGEITASLVRMICSAVLFNICVYTGS